MIPKVIHYCWFGGQEKPALAKKCIASWKKNCPDYQIIEWNESNFDVNMNGFTRMCVRENKWAFLSDYARLLIIQQQGGIYLDTDVEVLRTFDNLLHLGAFIGFENNKYLTTGLGFGAEARHRCTEAMLKEYDRFLDGKHGVEGCPILNTKAFLKLGLIADGTLQIIGDITILPVEYLNPYDDPTGQLSITENTRSIHWYGKSWMSNSKKWRVRLLRPFHRIFGVDFFKKH